MAQETLPPSTDLVKSASGMLDKLKTPVFWFAIGFIAAVVVTRKKKTVIG